jgi:macrolide-specific efflux system membrane fusion protein
MKRGVMISVTVLLVSIVVYAWGPMRSRQRVGDERDIPQLRVTRTDLAESTVALGTVKSKIGAEVKVGSRLSGIVSKLYVSVGDEVRPGDVLATLRNDDLDARADALRSQLASATAEKEFAESELRRLNQLGEILPQTEIDLARRNVKVRAAEVQKAQANLSEAEISLGYAVIRAPVAGTIASVSTYEGETIAASFASPTFVTIVDLEQLEVQAYVDETDIGRVRNGQRVFFRVDAFPGEQLEGEVRAIYPKPQLVNNVVNYIVIVDIVNPKRLELRPEMTAHITFLLDERTDVIALPRAALMREGGRSTVLVLEEDRWIQRTVTTGLQTPQRIEVTSGLRVGETVAADVQTWKRTQEEEQ